jgi:hypothetical protein
MRARPEAGLKDGVIGLADAGIAGDGDRVFFHQGCEAVDVHGIGLHDDEAAILRAGGELIGEDGIEVREYDPVEAIIFVEFLSDDGTDPADSNYHCICHKKIPDEGDVHER